MIYLTKSFICVIVSGWCNQVEFQSVFENVNAGRSRSEELREGYVDARPTVACTRDAR